MRFIKKIIRTGNIQWFKKLSLNYTSFVQEPWFLACKFSRQPEKNILFSFSLNFSFYGSYALYLIFSIYSLVGESGVKSPAGKKVPRAVVLNLEVLQQRQSVCFVAYWSMFYYEKFRYKTPSRFFSYCLHEIPAFGLSLSSP